MSIGEALAIVLVALLVEGAFGVFVVRMLLKSKTDSADQRLAERDSQIADLKSQIEAERTAGREAQAELVLAKEERARAQSVAEEAVRSRIEATTSKEEELRKLALDKDQDANRLVQQVRDECETRLHDKDLSVVAQLREMRHSCDRELAEKDLHIGEQKRLLADAEKKLSDAFDALSVKALKTVSDEFMKTAKATLEAAQTEAKGDLKLKQMAIEEMLKPVSDSLTKIEKQHAEMEQRRVSAFDSIEKGIKTLSEEADQLANALRKPSTRGAWGEMNLKVILDNAGLEEGLHYHVQDSTDDDEDGGRLRTDVIIHLPNGRDFIIDAKTPLESYWDGMNAPDEATRLMKFTSHARLVRDHIKKLSTKSYWSRYKAAPDCVVMFIPTEGAYQAAIEIDRAMLADAHRSRVYLANPMTLISMIHIAAYVLKEERSRQSATDIQAAAEELYKRVSKFVGDFETIGRHLKLSVSSYNTAVGSLEGRVLPKARDISRLGAGTGTELEQLSALESSPRELSSPESRQSTGLFASE